MCALIFKLLNCTADFEGFWNTDGILKDSKTWPSAEKLVSAEKRATLEKSNAPTEKLGEEAPAWFPFLIYKQD